MAKTFKIKDKVAEGQTLSILVEIDYDGTTIHRRIPIFGTYSKNYIKQSVKNYISTLNNMTPEKRQEVIDDSDREGMEFPVRKERATLAALGATALDSEVDVVQPGE